MTPEALNKMTSREKCIKCAKLTGAIKRIRTREQFLIDLEVWKKEEPHPNFDLTYPAIWEGYIPDYANDLNEMHKVEQSLIERDSNCAVHPCGEANSWIANLQYVCRNNRFGVFESTASQRLDAYLLTVG